MASGQLVEGSKGICEKESQQSKPIETQTASWKTWSKWFSRICKTNLISIYTYLYTHTHTQADVSSLHESLVSHAQTQCFCSATQASGSDVSILTLFTLMVRAWFRSLSRLGLGLDISNWALV